MPEPAPAAAAAPAAEAPPLSDVMLAMDVVDSLREIDTIATEPSAREAAARLAAEAGAAARAGDLVLARDRQALLRAMLAELNLSYRIRIAQRAGEPSDTWRVPAANPRGRNFYLIVEAVRDDKQDDGIIENDTVGEKRAGELSRRWRVETSGAAILKWQGGAGGGEAGARGGARGSIRSMPRSPVCLARCRRRWRPARTPRMTRWS